MCLFSAYFIDLTIEPRALKEKVFPLHNVQHQNDGINQERIKYGVQEMGFNKEGPRNLLGNCQKEARDSSCAANPESKWSRLEQENRGLQG